MLAQILASKLPPFLAATRPPSLHRFRPILAAGGAVLRQSVPVPASVSGGVIRPLSSRPRTSSLNDPATSQIDSPLQETLSYFEFDHWFVQMEVNPLLPRDQMINIFINTLAQVVRSQEKAKKMIYSVSTKYYFGFSITAPKELANVIITLPEVRRVLPQAYVNVKNLDFDGEPFINGVAVPYEPKYHEEYLKHLVRRSNKTQGPHETQSCQQQPPTSGGSRSYNKGQGDGNTFRYQSGGSAHHGGGYQGYEVAAALAQGPHETQTCQQQPPTSGGSRTYNTGQGGGNTFRYQSGGSAHHGGGYQGYEVDAALLIKKGFEMDAMLIMKGIR